MSDQTSLQLPTDLMIQLKGALKTRSLSRGPEIKLASGLSSNVYVDCKKTTLHGPSLKLVSRAYVEALRALDALRANVLPQVAGVSVGGDPLVAGVLLEAAAQGFEFEGLLIRKEPKSHGASQGKAVDGFAPRLGGGVWLLEDVVSTGGSSLKAAGFLRAEGYRLDGILTLVDREMGGVERLSKELGVKVVGLVKLSELDN